MLRVTLCALLLCTACDPALIDALQGLEGSSNPAASPDSDEVLPPVGTLLATSYDFAIESGKHRSDHDFVALPHLGEHVDRALSFTATFSQDAAYTTSAPSNQSDWNKLMGLSTDRIHDNSIRIGWRWNPATQLIELGSYGYLDGARVMPMIATVPLGQPIDCVLKMTDAGLYAQAGAGSYTQSGSNGVGFAITWVLHSAYFGGDETAPHQIHVAVSNISAQ
jgi:hypothetical protein